MVDIDNIQESENCSCGEGETCEHLDMNEPPTIPIIKDCNPNIVVFETSFKVMQSVSERMTPNVLENEIFKRIKPFINVQTYIDPIEDMVTYRVILKAPKEVL